MFTISKSFSFSAAHHLPGVADGHPCKRNHGHNYEVILTLAAASVDDSGMLYDYRNLDVFKHWLDDTIDHRDLNDIMENPTAENLAHYFFAKAFSILTPKEQSPDKSWPWWIHSVTVKETPQTAAVFQP